MDGGEVNTVNEGEQPPAAAGEPRRTLSALQVARQTGREKRIVLFWTKPQETGAPPCPHSMGVRRGQASPSFNLEEVKAWLTARGLPAVLTDVGNRTDGTDRTNGADGVTDLWSARVATFSGEVDYSALIRQCQAKLHSLLNAPAPAGAQPDWAERWATAVNGTSKELRQLEQAKWELETRRGDWIRRSASQEILDAAATEFTGAQRVLKGRLPAALAASLAELVSPEKIELARRAIALTVAAECDRVAGEVADSIEARVGVQEAA